MTNDTELEDLRQRLECLESKLADNNNPDSDIVPGRILTPTRKFTSNRSKLIV